MCTAGDSACGNRKTEEDFLQTDTELVALMFAHCKKVRYPILFSTDLNESLAIVPELNRGQLAGAYIIGPILTSEVTQESIIQYAGEKDLPLQYTYALVKKYQSIPVMSMDRFGALPKLVYYYIYQKALDTSNMTLVSGTEEISRSIIVSAISETNTGTPGPRRARQATSFFPPVFRSPSAPSTQRPHGLFQHREGAFPPLFTR